jgi:hypothetical protein
MFSSLQVEAIRRITVSLELCLDAAGLLFLPIWVLAQFWRGSRFGADLHH